MWQTWINLILGAWIIVSGYLDLTPETMTTNLTVSGLIIAGLALWGGVKERELIQHEHEMGHSHV